MHELAKYDEYAVTQTPRSKELLRYRRYGADLLLLELVNSSAAVQSKHPKAGSTLPVKDGLGQDRVCVP